MSGSMVDKTRFGGSAQGHRDENQRGLVNPSSSTSRSSVDTREDEEASHAQHAAYCAPMVGMGWSTEDKGPKNAHGSTMHSPKGTKRSLAGGPSQVRTNSLMTESETSKGSGERERESENERTDKLATTPRSFGGASSSRHASSSSSPSSSTTTFVASGGLGAGRSEPLGGPMMRSLFPLVSVSAGGAGGYAASSSSLSAVGSTSMMGDLGGGEYAEAYSEQMSSFGLSRSGGITGLHGASTGLSGSSLSPIDRHIGEGGSSVGGYGGGFGELLMLSSGQTYDNRGERAFSISRNHERSPRGNGGSPGTRSSPRVSGRTRINFQEKTVDTSNSQKPIREKIAENLKRRTPTRDPAMYPLSPSRRSDVSAPVSLDDEPPPPPPPPRRSPTSATSGSSEISELDLLYIRSRQRLLATTRGGLSYIPSPLARGAEKSLATASPVSYTNRLETPESTNSGITASHGGKRDVEPHPPTSPVWQAATDRVEMSRRPSRSPNQLGRRRVRRSLIDSEDDGSQSDDSVSTGGGTPNNARARESWNHRQRRQLSRPGNDASSDVVAKETSAAQDDTNTMTSSFLSRARTGSNASSFPGGTVLGWASFGFTSTSDNEVYGLKGKNNRRPPSQRGPWSLLTGASSRKVMSEGTEMRRRVNLPPPSPRTVGNPSRAHLPPTVPPTESANGASAMQRKFSNATLEKWEGCLLIRAEGGRTGSLRLTPSHLIFEFDDIDAEGIEQDISDSEENRYELGFAVDDNSSSQHDTAPRTGNKIEHVRSYSDVGSRLEYIFPYDEADENQEAVLSTATGAKRGEPEEVRLMRIRRQRKMNSSLSGSSSSSSSLSMDSVASSDDENYDNDEAMNACLIREIEEEARRRLRELEGDDDTSASQSTTVLAPSNEWERNHLRSIERKARKYMQKLEDGAENLCDDGEDDDVHSRPSIGDDLATDQNTPGGVCDFASTGTYASHRNQKNFLDEKEEARWYMVGEEASSRRSFLGVKWPLHMLAEAYPRRYMMRDVAFEIFAKSNPGPPSSWSSSFGVSSSSSSIPQTLPHLHTLASAGSVSSGAGSTLPDVDVPLGELSQDSFYIVTPEDEAREDTASSRRGKRFRKKVKSTRDAVIERIREQAPQMNTAYWNPIKEAGLYRRWRGSGRSSDGSGRESHRRSWAAAIFKRRGRSNPIYMLTRAWRKGNISNYDYLMRLNAVSGRSRHDPSHYPIMPWVLSNYTSESVPDLSDESNYRDLSLPMGALNPERRKKFRDKYESLRSSPESAVPPFMYGSHYSSAGGVVLHYLVRIRPFAGLHRQLQGGRFDVADRLFDSVPRTWEMCAHSSPTEVKELTPEWYSDPSFLVNSNDFDLGVNVTGKKLGNVTLPPWADGNPTKFVEVMRNALESDVCSSKLPAWIDLTFGCKQKGPAAEAALNVFYHITYYDTEDLARIEDEALRTEAELHIADFGHCPSQLFFKSHPLKKNEVLVSKSKDELRKMGGSRNNGKA